MKVYTLAQKITLGVSIILGMSLFSFIHYKKEGELGMVWLVSIGFTTCMLATVLTIAYRRRKKKWMEDGDDPSSH